MNAPPTFDDSNPGGLGTGGISNLATNYFSPWDIWFNRGYRDLQPSYGISNGTADGNNSPYTLQVHAWIGLAYFDGNNDGRFYDISPTQFSNPPLLVADMAANPTQYLNLFANGEEVGNLVKATITTPFQPQQGARIEDREHHLPMPDYPTSLGTLSDPRYLNTSPPWAFGFWKDGFDHLGALQPEEELLLRDYVKVFFYEVDVFEAATGAFVGTYILHPQIETLPQGTAKKWEKVPNVAGTAQLQGSLPFGSFNLHYHTDGTFNSTFYDNTGVGTGKCNSFELVFDVAGIIKHEHIIMGSVPKTLSMEIWQDSPTFWQRSAVHLKVH